MICKMLKFLASDSIFKVLHIANFGQLNCEYIKIFEFNAFKLTKQTIWSNFHRYLIPLTRSESTYKTY